MAEQKNNFRNIFNLTIFIAAVAFIGYMILHDPMNRQTAWNILKVLIGFGGVVVIHEFGHFVVAKMGGIKVKAFSVGFPPLFMGIKRTETGFRFRFLPMIFNRNPENPDDAGLVFTLPGKFKPGETEYKIGLIPFGGYVGMLGQDDTGPAEETNDPRSFANKPIPLRIAVVAAGVTFNAISAILIFMTVFMIGLELPPAVVGNVVPNSPAEIAGLQPGDRIIQINDQEFIDFTSIPMNAAISDEGEPLELKVKHLDGSVESMDVVASKPAASSLPVRAIGIEQAGTLKIADLKGPPAEMLYEQTGFKPGDEVVKVNGTDVEYAWQMDRLIEKTAAPTTTLTVKRKIDDGTEFVDVDVPLSLAATNRNFEKGYDLAHIYSMVPRLKISAVADRTSAQNWKDKIKLWWRENILRQEVETAKLPFEIGDILVQVGEVKNPTFKELRDVTEAHNNKPMSVKVIRKDETGNEKLMELTATPWQQFTRKGDGQVQLGIGVELDATHPVVAKTIDVQNGPANLNIESGAKITAVDGQKVKSFYDVMRVIRQNQGQRITLDYRVNEEVATAVNLDIPAGNDFITAKNLIAVNIPFKPLKEVYKAAGPIDAIAKGSKKTYSFIAQTLSTVLGLAKGNVDPTALSGPVGIATASYSIASTDTMYYVFFLGLISSVLAIMNLLPLPIVDGGVIILLLIEAIKGSPLSRLTQEIISYAGLAFIAFVFVWLFYNDILNLILA
ncbi:Regulator of sigma E protease [Anaerohalosphaera lusitana]|uniref:Regulator of sigma E protease n=1 Tax=Anaerohalosphaera lusitana TaxID=1936003 RepID=A0A1U9NNU3_9BACT|nr:site-2 protease family protein [Anaerohalosphaera lusitana]AQT69622.1 Regulator of sigma E protease [Anaerohalosphaera lusitana]